MVKYIFQMLKGSLFHSQWWDLTDPYFKGDSNPNDKYVLLERAL